MSVTFGPWFMNRIWEPPAISAPPVPLLRQACAGGAELRPLTKVRFVDVAHGRVTGVTTNCGQISAPIAVLAAGTGCRALASTCGVDVPLVAREIRVAEILLPESLRQIDAYMDPITVSWLSPREKGRALISVANARAAQPINPDAYDAAFTRTEARPVWNPCANACPASTAPVLR